MSIKQIIDEIYEENSNYTSPRQAINQAESLKSLSSDLYTDSKRFIYELLQNADDSSIKGSLVDVSIKLFDNVLVVAHTGKAFDNIDINGICNINNGTKKSSIDKTGYKGIGFKSVFGQSNKVTIFSNNEYFKFDSSHDFGWKKEWANSQKEWEEKNNRKFLYPWQIIPIYISYKEINNDIHTYLENWNVGTIIKLLEPKDIKKAISELSSNLNMFLFLKNVNSIEFSTDKSIKINIIRDKNKEIKLSKNTKTISEWLIRTIDLNISKDLQTSLQDERNIPEKLLLTTKIELTMAIKKESNKLIKMDETDNLLYAYLPTDEKRYSLPILVNTTFLMSANRESLHIDSKWNQWLFKSISIELFKWIAELNKSDYAYQAYQLIPKKLLITDSLSNEYNRGIEESLDSIPFILSQEASLLKVSEAIIDTTLLSEKDFVSKNSIVEFIKERIGDGNQIVKNPFIPLSFSELLESIGVATFRWSNMPTFFSCDKFLSKHTIEDNIKLIQYFKNETSIQDSSISNQDVKHWSFIYDQKNMLNYPNNIYFPTLEDTTWNSPDNALSFVNKEIQDWLKSNHNVREWLESLGVIEKTDISFLEKTIIPKAESFITFQNAEETISTIFSLYKKEKIDDKLKQLSQLKLLTKGGDLLSAGQCYFSNDYSPKLQIENVISSDIFISEKYLSLDNSIDEIKRFFRLMGVKESINIIDIKTKTLKSTLVNLSTFKESYFTHSGLNSYGFAVDSYRSIIGLDMQLRARRYKFAKVFWNDVIKNHKPADLTKNATAYWGYPNMPGQTTGSQVSNYLTWHIKNNKCIPTLQKKSNKSIDVFLNTDEIIKIADKYLPIFDGEILNQDWKAFFNFKTKLTLKNYLDVLSCVVEDLTEERKLKESNKKRFQLIFKQLLDESENWDSEQIEQIETWAKTASLIDESYNIVNCQELKYYADGDNSVFQNTYEFLALNEENKIHSNLDKILGYLGIEILRQSSFDIECKGEELQSDLQEKLKSIFPYFKNWIAKYDSEFIEEKSEKIHELFYDLQITEVKKIFLSYNRNTLKEVQFHFVENKLIVSKPWSSNKVLISLPKVLCEYFGLKGYEEKLEFLLREDDENEIKEYFKNENITLPVQSIVTKKEYEAFKEEAITTLNTNEAEFDVIKKISDNFYHTSDSSIEKLEHVHKLLKRSKDNIIKHLKTLNEYNCDDVDNHALTVLSGITKNEKDIFIIPRPSDNGQVILFYSSEYDVLEYADAELWYEDGKTTPKKLTLGKILKDTKINRIPV